MSTEAMCIDKEHIDRIRQKVKTANGLGPFWREMMLAALAAIDDLREMPPSPRQQESKMGDPMLGKCERCESDAIGFNEDGVALCEDCIFEESCRNAFPPEIDLEDERP